MRTLLLALLIALSGIRLTAAAPPPPTMVGQVGAPTGGFWLTNVTYVWTNAAVRTPTIDLNQVTVYGTNAIKNATILAWDAPTNSPGVVLAGYNLYYAMTSGGPTNKFSVATNITCALFYSSLATGTNWWAYVKAYDTTGAESAPSVQILFTPK